MCFLFYNFGALIYKGFFFLFVGGLKRRLNSPKGWAGPAHSLRRLKDMLPCALLGTAAEATEHDYESYLLPFVSHGDKTWV